LEPFKTIFPREICSDNFESRLKKRLTKSVVIGVRAATDTMLNKSIKMKNKAEIIKTLHGKERSSWLPVSDVKPLKLD